MIWSEVEKALKTFLPTEGGYSSARRGIITLRTGGKVFVKIGIDEQTNSWIAKEIKAYDFLKKVSYPYIPKLLCTNEDKTAFATEPLLPENGWNWSDTWNKDRLNATLEAMDALAAIRPDVKYDSLLKPVMTDEDNGWVKLAASDKLQSSLISKLGKLGETNLLGDLHSHVQKSSAFRVRHDELVHDDIRADNCSWNELSGEVRLVDWNWLELGDRRIDLAAMLVHVHASGFDVLPGFSSRLDAGALHWMAGFWFESTSRPIWPGGPEKVREVQLHAGITALRLALEVS